MESEEFAVGELNQSKPIIGVPILLQVAVHGGLTNGEDTVDLLFGVGKTLGHVKVVASDIDLASVPS